MNEQSTKKILFNKSTLLSLKAELLKKQEEVLEKKHLPKHNLELFKPAHRSSDGEIKRDNRKETKSFKDKLKAVDVEEYEACRKAKQMLEKKAELYKHLEDGAGESQLAGHFLVDFKSKKQEKTSRPEPEPEPEEEIQEPFEEDQGEWVEFTDFLGRTRKCLKSDLDHYKKRDEQLMKMVTNERNQDSAENDAQTPQDIEKPFLVQKTNDYLQLLREKWEKKEQDLLSKDEDIHYQDLLFDEARIHGVGYYAFSTDETERRKQMDELLKRRDETLKAQKLAEETRKKRDELIAARVAAARARQRIRAGLPPEDPEEKKKEFTTCLLKFLTEQRDAADKKAKEEESKAREEAEKERQKLREAYVREWDIGKEGNDDKPKKFREMTQEEYVEQQRAKRINEFAPFRSTNNNYSTNEFDTKGRKLNSDTNTPSVKTWTDVRRVQTPPPPDIGDLSDESMKGLYFTTKKNESMMKYKNFVKAQEPVPINNEQNLGNTKQNTKKDCVGRESPATYDPKLYDNSNMGTVKDKTWTDVRRVKTPPPTVIGDINTKTQMSSHITTEKNETLLKYKNFVRTQEPVPIDNELSDEEFSENIRSKPNKRKDGEEYVEIEPPATYDYYGPTPKHKKSDKPFNSDIREAMAQGNKSLERKESNRKLPQHYDFTFD